ncbi:MAG: hypothetical protein ABF611_03530 [Acetobacter orientalis]|uniref:hypothetical protein n=1 Tax=Acetobacter orientalis TaxID=146474 RepID=UPI0039E84836
MKFEDYITTIVQPTVDEFYRNSHSSRSAFLACLVIYHCVDYASPNLDRKSVRETTFLWNKESLAFSVIDVVANHIKHVKSMSQKDAEKGIRVDGIPIFQAIFKPQDSDADNLDLHSLYFLIRQAFAFVSSKANLNLS